MVHETTSRRDSSRPRRAKHALERGARRDEVVVDGVKERRNTGSSSPRRERVDERRMGRGARWTRGRGKAVISTGGHIPRLCEEGSRLVGCPGAAPQLPILDAVAVDLVDLAREHDPHSGSAGHEAHHDEVVRTPHSWLRIRHDHPDRRQAQRHEPVDGADATEQFSSTSDCIIDSQMTLPNKRSVRRRPERS